MLSRSVPTDFPYPSVLAPSTAAAAAAVNGAPVAGRASDPTTALAGPQASFVQNLWLAGGIGVGPHQQAITALSLTAQQEQQQQQQQQAQLLASKVFPSNNVGQPRADAVGTGEVAAGLALTESPGAAAPGTAEIGSLQPQGRGGGQSFTASAGAAAAVTSSGSAPMPLDFVSLQQQQQQEIAASGVGGMTTFGAPAPSVASADGSVCGATTGGGGDGSKTVRPPPTGSGVGFAGIQQTVVGGTADERGTSGGMGGSADGRAAKDAGSSAAEGADGDMFLPSRRPLREMGECDDWGAEGEEEFMSMLNLAMDEQVTVGGTYWGSQGGCF